MAKTIKFNLICDGYPVRTIEDLQNHFSIEDILDYYKNGLLCRWLKVRGYDAELDKVSAMGQNLKPMEIVKELIRIFEVSADEKSVEENVYALTYKEEREKHNADYEKSQANTERIIKDYEEGYKNLVKGILKNFSDVALVKANIAEIISNYAWILELNHRELFWSFIKQDAYLPVMCLLMREECRDYYLPKEVFQNDETILLDTQVDLDKKEMFETICWIVSADSFDDFVLEQLVNKCIFCFAGATDGYWKDLESKEKKYMVLSMGKGNYVRSAGKKGEELDYTAVNCRFPILDGIDYKSNSEDDVLVYMEV